MKKDKVKKLIDPDSKEWERKAIRIALNAVSISTCYTCGGPHLSGYVCDCGETNPDGEENRRSYWTRLNKQRNKKA